MRSLSALPKKPFLRSPTWATSSPSIRTLAGTYVNGLGLGARPQMSGPSALIGLRVCSRTVSQSAGARVSSTCSTRAPSNSQSASR